MVNLLLDTSVIIDVLRQYPPAQTWLSQQTDPGVAAIVWIELLQGVKDKNAQRRALTMLQDFERVDLVTADIDWAIQQLWQFKLSHNIGGNDCLIASVSHRLHLPLYTTNLKHFAPLLGALAQKPY